MIKSYAYDLLDDDQFQKLQDSLLNSNFIWTDPVWRNGALFRSTINKMGADGTWEEIMRRLALLCTRATLGLFVMMGKRFTPDMIKIFEQNGVPLSGQWEGVYTVSPVRRAVDKLLPNVVHHKGQGAAIWYKPL